MQIFPRFFVDIPRITSTQQDKLNHRALIKYANKQPPNQTTWSVLFTRRFCDLSKAIFCGGPIHRINNAGNLITLPGLYRVIVNGRPHFALTVLFKCNFSCQMYASQQPGWELVFIDGAPSSTNRCAQMSISEIGGGVGAQTPWRQRVHLLSI